MGFAWLMDGKEAHGKSGKKEKADLMNIPVCILGPLCEVNPLAPPLAGKAAQGGTEPQTP